MVAYNDFFLYTIATAIFGNIAFKYTQKFIRTGSARASRLLPENERNLYVT